MRYKRLDYTFIYKVYLVLESFSILSQAALSTSLNFCCICCTQSLPVTNIRAIISGSVSSLLSSNSLLASFLSLIFHGTPLSSHQWKALVVRRISLYNERASFREVEDLKNFAVRIDEGVIMVGGIFDCK